MSEIKEYIPEKEDYLRIIEKFDDYTELIGAPPYDKAQYALQILADDDKRILGEAIFEELRGIFELKLLFVAEECRKIGIGSKLIEAIYERALSKKAKAITAWTYSWQGEGFYERYGFIEAARLPLKTEGYFDDKPQFNILYVREISY